MPIWKYRGKKRQIPFNPELIARLLYDGHEVWPDEGAPEAQILREKTLINQNLKNLWGDKKMRVVDSDREVAVDETTEAPVFAPFKKVIPNPMIEQNMPAINPKEPPIGRQVKAPKSMVEMYAMGYQTLIRQNKKLRTLMTHWKRFKILFCISMHGGTLRQAQGAYK